MKHRLLLALVKKMKTSSDQEKLDTAGATTDMINFSAKFIMQNSDREKHLLFCIGLQRIPHLGGPYDYWYGGSS